MIQWSYKPDFSILPHWAAINTVNGNLYVGGFTPSNVHMYLKIEDEATSPALARDFGGLQVQHISVNEAVDRYLVISGNFS